MLHNKTMMCILSPDGNYLLKVNRFIATLCDVGGKIIRRVRMSGEIFSACFSSNSQQYALLTSSGALTLFNVHDDAAEGQPLRRKGTLGKECCSINAMRFLDNDKLLFLSTQVKRRYDFTLYDIANKKETIVYSSDKLIFRFDFNEYMQRILICQFSGMDNENKGLSEIVSLDPIAFKPLLLFARENFPFEYGCYICWYGEKILLSTQRFIECYANIDGRYVLEKRTLTNSGNGNTHKGISMIRGTDYAILNYFHTGFKLLNAKDMTITKAYDRVLFTTDTLGMSSDDSKLFLTFEGEKLSTGEYSDRCVLELNVQKFLNGDYDDLLRLNTKNRINLREY